MKVHRIVLAVLTPASTLIQVTHAKNQKPVVPHRCVVCGALRPAHTATLLAHDGSRHGAGYESWLRVPCCRFCAVRLHNWRLSRTLLASVYFFLALTGGAALAFSKIPGVPPQLAFDVGALAGLVVALLSGAALYLKFETTLAIRFQPAFSVELWNDRLRFRFALDDVGREFDKENPRHEVILAHESPAGANRAIAQRRSHRAESAAERRKSGRLVGSRDGGGVPVSRGEAPAGVRRGLRLLHRRGDD